MSAQQDDGMGDFWVFIIAAVLMVTFAIWTSLRSQKVGSLESLPTRVGSSTVHVRVTVSREPLPYDDAMVYVTYSGAAYVSRNELSSREALQAAIWLETGCESSNDFFGWAGCCGVSSVYEKSAYVVQLSFYDGERTFVTDLTPSRARLLASWLRVAAAPGKTLADARRRMPKATA
jgi:hypothetical protein